MTSVLKEELEIIHLPLLMLLVLSDIYHFEH